MRWSDNIVIDRPLVAVLEAISNEHELMRWSAWPAATGFTCAIDGDGRSLGSEIVFTDRNGVEQGRQRLTAITADRVEYRLDNRGPGGRRMTPAVDFRLEPQGASRTRVHLDFRGEVPLPPPLRQLAEVLVGRRVRAVHVKDLEQLKLHVERVQP